MSKDIKKALEHCIEWNCIDCPNREELGSGETVCRGRLLPEVLKYVADLETKLAEKEKEIEKLNACVDFYKSYYISFKDKVIDELEKLKNYIITDEKDIFGANYLMKSGYVLEFIDNQIKELKGEKE